MLYILILVVIPICCELIINCCLKQISAEQKSKIKYCFTIIYSLFEMVFLLITLYNHNYVHDYNLTSYYVNYSNGFLSRGMIGSICSFLFEYNFLYEYKVIAMYLLVFALSYILQITIYVKIYKKLLEKNSFFEDYFCLFMTSFANVSFFLTCECVGIRFIEFMKLDLFNYFLTLIIVILFLRKKTGIVTYIITTILASISILVHQGTFFTYHNLILFLVGYEAFFVDKNITKKVMFIIFFIVTCSVLGLCQFVDIVPFEIISNECKEALSRSERTYTIQHDEFLTMEYDISVLEHFKFYGMEYVSAFWIMGIDFLVKYLLILYVLIYMLMQKNLKIFKNNLLKLFLLYVIVMKLALFLLTMDWIRWVTFTLQEITFMVAYLIIRDKIENTKIGE